MQELDQEMKELEQEVQEIEQVPNTYYYDKICDDQHLGSFTESTQLAHQLGWQDNTVAITDTEVSEVNGWTYLKGYAPKKPLETLKEEKHAELKAIMQSKRNALTCEYNNDVFDCNEQAQSNMTSLMGFANLGMTEFSIRSTTEVTRTFNNEQLVELAMLMSKTVNDLYSEYWNLKNALYECESKEEIDAIRWTDEN